MNNRLFEKLTENGRMSNNVEVYKDLMDLYHHGSEQTKQAIRDVVVELMSPYIGSIIKKKFPTMMEHYVPLFNEGVVAVLESLNSYNPYEYDTLPITYFTFAIKFRMSEYVSNEIYKTNRYYGKQVRLVKEAIQYFQVNGYNYTEWDIANRTGLTMKQIRDSMTQIDRNESECGYIFEMDLEKMDNRSIEGPEAQYLKKEIKEAIVSALEDLDEEDKILISEKFEDNKEKSIMELSKLHPEMDYNEIKARVARGMRRLKGNITLRRLYLGDYYHNREREILNQESMIYFDLEDETANEIFLDDEDDGHVVISPAI